jgi:hypothetical protein
MTSLYGLSKTEEVAAYLKKLFVSELQRKKGEVRMPNWDLNFLEEIHYAVKTLILAIRNQSKK